MPFTVPEIVPLIVEPNIFLTDIFLTPISSKIFVANPVYLLDIQICHTVAHGSKCVSCTCIYLSTLLCKYRYPKRGHIECVRT